MAYDADDQKLYADDPLTFDLDMPTEPPVVHKEDDGTTPVVLELAGERLAKEKQIRLELEREREERELLNRLAAVQRAYIHCKKLRFEHPFTFEMVEFEQEPDF